MAVIDGKAFLVVSTGHGAWGKAATLPEATRNMKRAAGMRAREKVKAAVIVFTCEPDKLQIFEGPSLGYEWPQDDRAIRFEIEV
jgi:hypothetical protein